MKTENNRKHIKYRIKDISLLSLKIELKKELIDKEVSDKKTFQNHIFDVQCTNNTILNEGLIIIETNVNVFLDENKKIRLGNILTANIFEVQDLKEYYNKQEKRLILPEIFEATIIGLSISHTRAMFASRTAGTFLEHVYIPVLNPRDFLRIRDKKLKSKN
ncbi:MAG: hypothetical protein ISS16_00505 [Ignavibacteria bacterium]|nr:hypothetical protein [Ignavibacteria bacterium]